MRRLPPILCGTAAGSLAWLPIVLLVLFHPDGVHWLAAAATGAVAYYGLLTISLHVAHLWCRRVGFFWAGFASGVVALPLLLRFLLDGLGAGPPG